VSARTGGRRLKPTLQAEARATADKGFTLIELMISISLVVALAMGMLSCNSIVA
jgi:prepilin-type N-terminal cleavage/methylation domain-containing protein